MARRKKKPAVPAGRRSTTSGSGARASQQLAGKRKANELACSGESMEPGNRRPAPGAGSAPLHANLSATGEQAAVESRQPAAGNRQTEPSGGEATYAVVLAGPVALSQTSEPLKPTATDSDLSEPGVSMKTTNKRVSSDMSGSLSGIPDGTTSNVQVANSCLPAGERPNKTAIYISGVIDARSFLAWLRASCPGSLMAQLKGEKLMVVPTTAEVFRAAVSALRSIYWKEG